MKKISYKVQNKTKFNFNFCIENQINRLVSIDESTQTKKLKVNNVLSLVDVP